MMRDKRLINKVKQIMAERREEDARPSLEGYSREAKGLHELAVIVVRMHRTLARNLRIEEPKGPLTMGDMIAAEQKAREDEQFDGLVDDIYASMAEAKPRKTFVTKEANA
jgi:hypothetical protein